VPEAAALRIWRLSHTRHDEFFVKPKRSCGTSWDLTHAIDRQGYPRNVAESDEPPLFMANENGVEISGLMEKLTE
jgi:hypothetical protein